MPPKAVSANVFKEPEEDVLLAKIRSGVGEIDVTARVLAEYDFKDYKHVICYAYAHSPLPKIKAIEDIFLASCPADKRDERFKTLTDMTTKDGRSLLDLAIGRDEEDIIRWIGGVVGAEVRSHYYIPPTDRNLAYSVKNNKQKAFRTLIELRAPVARETQSALRVASDDFKAFFFTPKQFLVYADTTPDDPRHRLLNEFFVHIKSLESKPERQAPFLRALNAQHMNALMLIAKMGSEDDFRNFSAFPFDRHVIAVGGEDNNLSVFGLIKKYGKLSLTPYALKEARIINPSDGEIIKEYIDSPAPLGDKKELGEALTLKSTTHQDGRLCLLHPHPIIRPSRSFSEHRERQILRHISTQLYGGFMDSDIVVGDLVEVQAMHLTYTLGDEKKSICFIALNKYSIAASLWDMINTREKFNEAIKMAHVFGGREDHVRSPRYASKLKQRVIDPDPELPALPDDRTEDVNRVIVLKRLLKEAEIRRFDYKYATLSTDLDLGVLPASLILFVVVNSTPPKASPLRHAEEFLVDLYEAIYTKDGVSNVRASIAGKKRPCMGCYGRMKSAAEGGGALAFGDKPGRYWVHSMRGQELPAAKETAKALLGESYVSLGFGGSHCKDYDSASDSEPE